MRYTKVSMVLKKTKNTVKTRSKKTITTARARTSPGRRFNSWLVRTNARLTRRYQGFLDRRPHRSFQLTRRRDYVRSLRLPGYISFTLFVWRTLQRHRRTFLLLVLLYGFSMMALGGITNQQAYSQISELLQEAGPEVFTGGTGKLGEAGLLLLSTFASGPGVLTVEQQIFLGLALLLAWLTTVWLLREYLLGRRPRLRDGLYNSGSPFVSTFIVVFVLILQCLPAGIVALIYAALSSVGLLENGFSSMLFWIFAVTVGALVLYWVTSTIIALVVVTLPGMYPLRALKSSGDLVVGRRLRIMYRLLWGMFMIVVAWAVVFIPLLILDTAVKDAWSAVSDVPTMPMAAAVMSAASSVWLAAYVYLLYRKVVDDDAKPA